MLSTRTITVILIIRSHSQDTYVCAACESYGNCGDNGNDTGAPPIWLLHVASFASAVDFRITWSGGEMKWRRQKNGSRDESDARLCGMINLNLIDESTLLGFTCNL